MLLPFRTISDVRCIWAHACFVGLLQVDVLVSLSERKALAVSGGGGFKQGEGFGGVFGTASFSHRNLFGQGQKLAGSLELGQVRY